MSRRDESTYRCSNRITKYKCKTCRKFQTNFLTELKTHIRDVHGGTSSDENLYECLTPSTEYLLGEHSIFGECATNNEDAELNRIIYYDQPESNVRSGNEPVNCSQCEHCLASFTRKEHLKRHILACHTDEELIQWYACECCLAKFKRKEHLKRHFLSCHASPQLIQWFECGHCSAKFKRKEHLKRHFQGSHTKPEEIQWYSCEYCSVKFKQKSNLTQHARGCRSKTDVVLIQGDQ